MPAKSSANVPNFSMLASKTRRPDVSIDQESKQRFEASNDAQSLVCTPGLLLNEGQALREIRRKRTG